KDGYAGTVTEGVNLDYDMDEVHSWADGDARPEACVGRAKGDPKRYKVFKYRRDLPSAGYQPVAGTAVVFGSWADYLKVRHPEDLSEEEWYVSLDRIDEASRRRRQRGQAPLMPGGAGRDDVAAWLANRHRFADSAIREVW